MRDSNCGLEPVVTVECPHCYQPLQVWRRWAEGVAKEPPPCPICGKAVLERDTGDRKDSVTGKPYKHFYTIEVIRIRAIRREAE